MKDEHEPPTIIIGTSHKKHVAFKISKLLKQSCTNQRRSFTEVFYSRFHVNQMTAAAFYLTRIAEVKTSANRYT